MASPASTPMPVLQAIVLCDQAYQDHETRKFVLAGTFSEIGALTFPAIHSVCFLYARLRDVPQRVSLRFRLVDLTDASVLGESNTITRDHPDRLKPFEFAIRVPAFPIPHAGFYAVELLWGADGAVLGEWRFEAIQRT